MTEISHMAFPAYAEKWNKLQELRASYTQVDADINNLLSRSRDKTDAGQVRIARLLGDPVAPRNEFALDSAKIAEHVRHRDDIRNAIQEMQRRVGDEKNIVDEAICARIKPEHDKLAADLCRALIALLEPLAAYTKFADKLNAEGVAWSGRMYPSHFRAVGDPTQKDGRIAMYLNEMARNGIISQEIIPAALRHEWPKPVAVIAKAPAPPRRAPTDDAEWSAVA